MSLAPGTIFSQPVPNNPFYSPQTTYVQGPYHWWLSAPGNTGFDFATGTITAGGGGGGTGTVTSITAGTGLTGGTINVSGTIAIANTGVIAGTYDNPLITVNSQGQLTGIIPQGAALTTNLLLAKGDLITATGPATPTILPVGASGYILSADSTTGTGLRWIANSVSITNATPVVTGVMYGCTPIIGTTCNTSLGYSALLNSLGVCNTAVGYYSQLSAAGLAARNSSLGTCSLQSNISGCDNTAIGSSALRNNTIGKFNTAVGANSLYNNVTAIGNTAVGSEALCLSVGNYNTAVGQSALQCSTSSQNTAIGVQSLLCVTGVGNTALGYNSLRQMVSGTYNLALGYQAGDQPNSGDRNVIIGPFVQPVTPGASCQLSIGFASGFYWLTGDSNRAIRPGAGIIDSAGSCGLSTQVLSSTGANSVLWVNGGGSSTVPNATPTVYGLVLGCTSVNIGITCGKVSLGCNALLSTTGNGNTAIGNYSQATANAGSSNTSVGMCSLRDLTGGTGTVAIGFNALCGAQGAYCSVAVGLLANACAVTSTDNTTVGAFSGYQSTGSGNTAVGSCSLFGAADANNVAIGLRSLFSVGAAGSSNTAVGSCSLVSAVSGTSNVAVGFCTMAAGLTAGSGNVALGTCALLNAASNNNVAVGFVAGGATTTGSNNTFVGTLAGRFTSTGLSNVMVGGNAGCCNVSGSFNTALGFCANLLATGSLNTAIGYNVQVASLAGDCQLAIGFSATDNWLTGLSTKAIKPGAGIIDCANSCGLAGQVLSSVGPSNAILWTSSGASGIPCACITAKGSLVTGTAAAAPVALPVGANGLVLTACSTATSGLCWAAAGGGGSAATPTVLGTVYGCVSVGNTTALGYGSLTAGGGNGYNTVIGSNSLCSLTTGSQNVAIGGSSLRLNRTGEGNVAIGGSTLGNNLSGIGNIALGVSAEACNTSGSCNIGIGYVSLFFNTIGSQNTAIGSCALYCNTSANNNVAIGQAAGCCINGPTAGQNTLVGTFAGRLLTTGCGNTLIGYNAAALSTTSNITVIADGAGAACKSGTGVWSNTSDCRQKECIQDLPLGLAFVNELRPVTWLWNDNERNCRVMVGKKQSGFVAQEVVALQYKNDAPYLGLGNDDNPDEYTVGLSAAVPVLVNAIKELSAELTALKAEVAALKQQA